MKDVIMNPIIIMLDVRCKNLRMKMLKKNKEFVYFNYFKKNAISVAKIISIFPSAIFLNT